MLNTRYAAVEILFAVLIAAMGTFAPPATAEIVRAVEYYHQQFEHYFVTANPAEISALDSGAFEGWWRTGQRYRVDNAPAADLVPVCRFYTAAYAGKASHFFTASAAECEHVKTMRDWTYEGVAFYARVPDPAGNCGGSTAPINRLFNNGRGGAPNHAYTADRAKRDTLVGAGWTYEGVAFCTSLSDYAFKWWSSQSEFLGEYEAWDKTDLLAGSRWIFGNRGFIFSEFKGWGNVFPGPYYGEPSRFVDFGFPRKLLWVMRENPGTSVDVPWSAYFIAEAAWDPLSRAYILIGSNEYAWQPQGFQGFVDLFAWTFDDAHGPSAPFCAMRGSRNDLNGKLFDPQSGKPYEPHPFQPFLWSGCESGVANRY